MTSLQLFRAYFRGTHPDQLLAEFPEVRELYPADLSGCIDPWGYPVSQID